MREALRVLEREGLVRLHWLRRQRDTRGEKQEDK
nr:hypothetical protein [Saccharopolyspora sp. ASAGF58]